MTEIPKKVEIARGNWYETDCKGLSVAVIKDAYERGFNRAFQLLSKYGSRLMTLEEVAGCVALGREIPVYMEFGPGATHAGKVIGLIPKYMYFDDEHGLSWDVVEGPDQGKNDGVSLYEYNDIWRCWTLPPTDMQKEAVKWDGQVQLADQKA